MPQLPSWSEIKQRMISAGESPDSIQSAFEEYQVLSGSQVSPQAGVSRAPTLADDISPAQTATVQKSLSRQGPVFEVVNPSAMELEKTAEGVANARDMLDVLDTIRETADKLIPAPDTVKLGPIESGFMGDVVGLQRTLGNMPLIRTEDTGVRSWEQYKSSIGSIMARGFGEKGVLTNADIDRVLQWLPKPNDTNQLRQTNFENIRKFVSAKIKSANKRLISLSPDLQTQFQSVPETERDSYLEGLVMRRASNS